MNHGQCQRNDDGRNHIDNDGIANQRLRISAKFASDYGCSCGSRSNHTNHSSFEHYAKLCVRKQNERYTQQTKNTHLNQQQPQVHATWAQITRIDFAKGNKEHQKDQGGLDNGDEFVDKWFGWCQEGDVYINKVADNTCKHRKWECPVFDKSYQFHG